MAAFDHAEMLLEGVEQDLQQRIDMLLEVNENYRGKFLVLFASQMCLCNYYQYIGDWLRCPHTCI